MPELTMAISLLILATRVGLAQTAQDSWDNLKQLRAGQKIEVVDMNLKSVKGTFVAHSAEAITV